MRIYHYNKRTAAYVGSTEAAPNPLEPGQFLIPANATPVEPPEAVEGKVARWNGQAWELTDQVTLVPDDLEPGPPVFPEDPIDGQIVWSTDGTETCAYVYNESRNEWDLHEIHQSESNKINEQMLAYATKQYVHDFVEQKMEELKKELAKMAQASKT